MKRARESRESWKKRYAKAAAEEEPIRPDGADPVQLAKSIGYSEQEIRSVPESALSSGLGCGNPTALAELKEGETVLDLGCGAGLDVFIACRKVGPVGKVIGVDMTPEMVEKARAAAVGFRNAEFRLGEIERLPVADASVDVVISNCVISHCPDKLAAFKEAFRVLRPAGRMLISDLVTSGKIAAVTGPGAEAWAQWLAGAPRKPDYLAAMKRAGFRSVSVVSERSFDYPQMPDALRGRILSLHIRALRRS
jgi:SAM-dependent methyltransferase